MFLITQIKNKLSIQKFAGTINIDVNHLSLDNIPTGQFVTQNWLALKW